MTAPRKKPAAKKAAPPAKDTTRKFIEGVKQSAAPVTAADQLAAQAVTTRRAKFSSKGTTAEFEALMTKIKRHVAQKGIKSMDDI